MKIRSETLTPERIKELALFEQQAFGYDGTLLDKNVQKVIAENNILAALDDQGKTLGHLRYKNQPNPYISGLVVDPAARGQGIGTALVQQLMKLQQPIDLNVLNKNLQAQKLYEKLGFTRVPSKLSGSMEYRWEGDK